MESKLERVGGVAAILGIIVLVFANIQLGTPPKSEDPATKTAMFLADKRGQVLLYVALFAIAYILLVSFGAALRQLLRRSGDTSALPDLVFGSVVWIVAVGFASLLAVGAAAYRSPGVSPGTAQVLSDVTSIGFAVLGAPFAVLFASASISAMKTRALPRWVGWLGLLTAVLNVAKLLTIFPRSGGFAPNGGAGLLFLVPIWVWTIAVAIVMWRGSFHPVPGKVLAGS